MHYEWLLFDADGTLFDYDKAEVKALENTFYEFGHPYHTQTGETYRRINGQIWQALERGEITPQALRTARFEQLFTAVHIQADPLPFSDAYLRHLANCGDLIDGADMLITQLRQTHRLALITNGLSDVQRPRLAASSLHDAFETITISDEVGFAKPDGRIFEAAFAEMGHPPKERVLIIGDSLTSDMQGGHDYHIDTCWFNPNGQTAVPGITITYEIKTLTDLVDIL